ncbi:MAG: N-acetylglucosamine-6-phosphate deacetylase [Clostridiales bacterium]|nr:N-acetylglucosamine-6-phosphate deacetylase [Clostridiales bacterium]
MILFKNAKIVSGGSVKNGDVLTKGKRIAKTGSFTVGDDCTVIDCAGMYLSPGFIDLHVHGGGGYSAMSTEPDDIIGMCKAHAMHGTTSLLPTMLSSPAKKMIEAARSVSDAADKCKYANILGVNFEGPFLSEKATGAQSDKAVFKIDNKTVDVLLSVPNLKMMTAAPELEGAMELGKSLKENGIIASIGHTASDYNTAMEAFENGFSDITHIYNASTACHKEGIYRVAGVVEAALCDDRCNVQFIADLKHLPVGVIRLIYKCKGSKKAYLITDGLEFSATDLKEGQKVKQRNGVTAVYRDGAMQTEDRSCLAGSVATMDSLVKNIYKVVGIPLANAVEMATSTPARLIGLSKEKGLIKKDYDADIIVFDDDINIKHVMIDGKLIKEA